MRQQRQPTVRERLQPGAQPEGCARVCAPGVLSHEMVQPASGELVKQRELLGLPGFGWWCEAGQDVTRKLACFIKQGIKVG